MCYPRQPYSLGIRLPKAPVIFGVTAAIVLTTVYLLSLVDVVGLLEGTSKDSKRRVIPQQEGMLFRIVPSPSVDTPPAWSTADATHVRSLNGTIEVIFPHIRVRDRLQAEVGHGPKAWRSQTMPHDEFIIPQWASVSERNTLQHASILVSISAFRDAECATTLRSLYEDAASPHRVYMAISEERSPTDPNCLAPLGLSGEADTRSSNWVGTAQRLLYGKHAPQGLGISLDTLTWKEVVSAPFVNIRADGHRSLGPTTATPLKSRNGRQAVYMEDVHVVSDRLLCVRGEVEAERDRFLQSGTNRPSRVRREGQSRAPSALSGCRVLSRVTPFRNARGPTFARYLTSLLYLHQDYYMIVDSHSRFAVQWDRKMIRRVFQMPSRGVLSHYPNGYTPEQPVAEYRNAVTMVMCRGVVLSNGMPKLGAGWIHHLDRPVIAAFAAAGYMFGDAQFILDVPFDPFLPYLFDGEEITYSARLWTSGWDLYSPAEANIFHHYGRANTPKFWSLMNTDRVALQELSKKRALYLLRRAHPWHEVLEQEKKRVEAQPQPPGTPGVPRPSFDPSTVPYAPPASRPIVTNEMLQALPSLRVEESRYGMGQTRSLDDYWKHTSLTDADIVSRDDEHRWMGGRRLCEDAATL